MNGNALSPKSSAGHAVEELDALIVGAGFGGTYQLHRLRQEGFKCKVVDSACDYGGIWYWHRYPGARCDTDLPHYAFSDPELYTKWRWTQRFPGSAELQDYFAFVADQWDLRKDTYFNTKVIAAAWDDEDEQWHIATDTGKRFHAKFFLLSTGIAARRYVPDWKGYDKFQGTWLNPSDWPKDEPEMQGKRVALIGTGATGVQIAQTLGKVVGELAVFQRTPNLSLPMRQVDYASDERPFSDKDLARVFAGRTQSFGGFAMNFLPRKTFDDTPEDRQKTYQQLWDQGDFSFWLATYYDMMFDPEANKEAYSFWRDKVRARIQDPVRQEILAPMVQPHAFGCKRVALENGYYEIFNRSNVSLVNLNSTPILEFTEHGIKTSEREWRFDYIILATGFDAITGGFKNIDIRGQKGQKLTDKWSDGTKTYMGMAVSGFPNMFFTYGPQAPTSLCNGPTCAELQGEWIVQLLNSMREKGQSTVIAQEPAEAKWAKSVSDLANMSLLPTTKSVRSQSTANSNDPPS
jgi:cation diffusion facilitator CzcD-associated flavoprotein CzcO